MTELVNEIASFVEMLILTVGYPGIFLAMFLENLVPPVPTDPFLPFAGVMIARGGMSFAGVWAAAISGATAGSLLLYLLGLYLGEPAMRGIVRKYGRYLSISETELDRSLSLFNHYGSMMVFFGRMMPVLRNAVSLTAGASRMNIIKFLVFSTASSAAVTGFWIFLGYLVGENWEEALQVVARYQSLLLVMLVALVLGLVIFSLVRRRRVSTLTQPQEPSAPC